jgi:hypothetical protein
MRKHKRHRAKIPDQPPASSYPLGASDVLDVIGSKGVAKREMHDIIHAPDDGVSEQRLGPQEQPSVRFRPDPEVGDAGAEFAEEFGQNYLRAATSGEDLDELEHATEMDPTEVGGPFLIETPRPRHARRRRHRPTA